MDAITATRTADDLKYTLTARTHKITTDAQREDGGTDEGPTPHELLAAALAGCTSITVQMYANRKGWALKSCNTEVDIKPTDKTDPNSTTVFEVTVHFEGISDFDQRKRLLEIAHRCPVHRALTRPIEIRLKEST